MVIESRRLGPSEYRTLPWRNGRGTTTELAIGPSGTSFAAGDFDWRLARAPILEDGPFSNFEGFERLLVVVRGRGLHLEHDSDEGMQRRRLDRGEVHAFSGSAKTRASLVEDAVEDVNLMFRPDHVRAELECCELAAASACRELVPGDTLVLAVDGTTLVHVGETPYRLAPEELLWMSCTEPGKVSLKGPSTVLIAAITRLR